MPSQAQILGHVVNICNTVTPSIHDIISNLSDQQQQLKRTIPKTLDSDETRHFYLFDELKLLFQKWKNIAV